MLAAWSATRARRCSPRGARSTCNSPARSPATTSSSRSTGSCSACRFSCSCSSFCSGSSASRSAPSSATRSQPRAGARPARAGLLVSCRGNPSRRTRHTPRPRSCSVWSFPAAAWPWSWPARTARSPSSRPAFTRLYDSLMALQRWQFLGLVDGLHVRGGEPRFASVFYHMPQVADSISQLFQARIFAAGKLFLPIARVPGLLRLHACHQRGRRDRPPGFRLRGRGLAGPGRPLVLAVPVPAPAHPGAGRAHRGAVGHQPAARGAARSARSTSSAAKCTTRRPAASVRCSARCRRSSSTCRPSS